MARSTPTTQNITDDGLTATMAAPNSDGDIADCGAGVFATILNGSGAPITVTLITPGTSHGLAIADRTTSIAAGASKDVPLKGYYKQPADAVTGPGQCLIDYSAVASVTRAIKKLV